MALSAADLIHLRRCVDLAERAVESGDEGFGSILVDFAGTERYADHNRVSGGDHTQHPEFAIARWAADHLTAEERAAATVYTSGEHCPMCAAAHGWVGLGRIVYASSSAQLQRWRSDLNAPDAPVAALPIGAVVPGAVVDGPAPELADRLYALHARSLGVPVPDGARTAAGVPVGRPHRVRIVVGPALESVRALIEAGEAAYDLVFIDADKTNNANYLAAAVELSHPGTAIVVDNVVRGGRVADADSDDGNIRGARTVIEAMGTHPRLAATAVQTVGLKGWDGFALAVVGSDGSSASDG